MDDRAFVNVEAEASMVREHEIGHVPGLLQTEACPALAVRDSKADDSQVLAVSDSAWRAFTSRTSSRLDSAAA